MAGRGQHYQHLQDHHHCCHPNHHHSIININVFMIIIILITIISIINTNNFMIMIILITIISSPLSWPSRSWWWSWSDHPPETSCTLPRTCSMWAASPSPPATPSSAAGPGWTGRTCPRCSRCPEKLFHEIDTRCANIQNWFTKLIQNLCTKYKILKIASL